MRRTMLRFDIVPWGNLSKLAGVALLLAGSLAGRCDAQQAGEKTFASADEAAHALVTAAQNNDEKLMLEILDNSAAKSGLIAYKAPFVFRRDFTPNFATKWMHKDVGLMLESGKELGVPLFLTSLTHQLFETAIAAGHGDQDMCSTINILEEIVGVCVESH